jgi:hypothetical protein
MKTTKVYFPPSVTESGVPQLITYELESSDIYQGGMGDLFLYEERIGLVVAQDNGHTVHMWIGGLATSTLSMLSMGHGTIVEWMKNPNTEITEGKPDHIVWNQPF